MATTEEDLEEWFKRGKKLKDVTHMIVAADMFSYEDYPVYVKKGESVHDKVAEYQSKNMSKVMEVYSYKKTWDAQKIGRVWNLD